MALALLTTTYRDNVYRWNGPVNVNLLLDNRRFPPVFRRLSLKCHPDRNKSPTAHTIFKALNTVSTAHNDVSNLSLEWNGLFTLYRNTRFQLLRDHHSVNNRTRFEAFLIHRDTDFHPELREGGGRRTGGAVRPLLSAAARAPPTQRVVTGRRGRGVHPLAARPELFDALPPRHTSLSTEACALTRTYLPPADGRNDTGRVCTPLRNTRAPSVANATDHTAHQPLAGGVLVRLPYGPVSATPWGGALLAL